METTPAIVLHLSAALAATAIGPVALWARLGRQQRPRLHRAFGLAWVGLMLLTALSALFIRETHLPNLAGFTPIHLFVPVTLAALFGAFRRLARGDVAGHAAIMRRLYVGACLVAGAFTLAPQRLLGRAAWGRLAGLLPILQNTPAWVWGLLAGLIVLGWLQSRDRTAGLLSVSALPLGLTLFSLWAVLGAFGRSGLIAEVLALWLLAALAMALRVAQGSAGAWYDRGTRSFDLAGSWTPMALFLAVFLTRYGVAVALTLDPALRYHAPFVLPVATLYGAFSGVFLGRAARLWKLALRPVAPLAA